MADEILTERRGRTLVITINRPQARNAFNLPVAQGLAAAMDELDDSPELSVGVLTGAGGNFSAGMDLKAFASGELPYVPGRGIGFTERPPRKPLIDLTRRNIGPLNSKECEHGSQPGNRATQLPETLRLCSDP